MRLKNVKTRIAFCDSCLFSIQTFRIGCDTMPGQNVRVAALVIQRLGYLKTSAMVLIFTYTNKLRCGHRMIAKTMQGVYQAIMVNC